jgi:hypothetical protein
MINSKVTERPRTAPVRRPRSALTRVDFLLIAACALTFLTIAVAHYPHARAKNNADPISANLHEWPGHASSNPGLVKARIGFARMASH